MKVLLLSFCFTEYCVKLSNSLSKHSTVKLMLPENVDADVIKHLDKGVELELFRKVKRSSPSNLLYSLGIVHSINSYMPDIVHIQCNGHAWFSFMFPLIQRKFKIVFTIHDPVSHPGEETFVRNASNKFVRRVGSRFIVHASALRDEMVSTHNMNRSQIDVVPMGSYNFKEENTFKYPQTGLNALFFGRIQDYKGIEYLVAAEPFITKEIDDFKITIAGTGKSLEPYLEKIKNIDKFNILNRYISEHELEELFNMASFLVLPYTQASQSGVIALAYSYCKPVIVTDVGGMPEVVDDGETGLVIPVHDAEKLAEAILKLFKNKDMLLRMGENSYKKLRKDLSWEKISRETIEVYRRCLEKPLR